MAAVALLLPHPTRSKMPRRTLGFLAALHDIGKYSRSFQSQAPEHWPADILGPVPGTRLAGWRHDAMGWHLLQTLADALNPVLPPKNSPARGWTNGDLGFLFQALAGHHGRPVELTGARPAPDVACHDAAQAFVTAMLDVFRPPSLHLPPGRGAAARLGWDLAGVVTLADWIGSREAWFPYVSEQAVADPSSYLWDHALPRAAAALASAGLADARASRFAGVSGLFPTIETPSPIQTWAAEVGLPAGPVLAVIEDVTGSGKTEAAITLAHRLLASGRAGGVFLALPTMATANAMFARMAGAYRGLFAAEARPSLALAHGRAELDTLFAAAIEGGPSPGRESADPADTPAEAHCASWLAEDRRRALLAQFGVGTIDQALLAVLPVRHAALRQQGLKGKVLIIDEAHAFDAYMQRELQELLRFHAALGGSCILLSATLPQAVRQRLVDAFRDGLGAPPLGLSETAYPLATLASADASTEQPCALRDGLARSVRVTRLPDKAAALERVAEAARAGAAVAWIRNTVDDVLAAAEALQAVGLRALVFHARFAMVDRLAVEAEVMRRFGRLSAGSDRGCVLVASQVVEQSLDLDFDVLCTDLAPIDLLIQRAGRLWRHKREPSERPMPRAPELLVVSPDPVDDPAPDWVRGPQPGTAAVYRDPALLWRGARALFAAGALTTPGDMRPLLELAGNADCAPPGLSNDAQIAAGLATAHTDLGRQNVLSLHAGYTRQNGSWDPDTITPTRLEERPRVTLRLALERNGVVEPYAKADTLARAWSLSEVVVAAHRVAACLTPPGLALAAEAARAGWGRWERDSPRVLLAVMTPSSDGYRLSVQTGSGTVAFVRYDPWMGLLMQLSQME